MNVSTISGLSQKKAPSSLNEHYLNTCENEMFVYQHYVSAANRIYGSQNSKAGTFMPNIPV